MVYLWTILIASICCVVYNFFGYVGLSVSFVLLGLLLNKIADDDGFCLISFLDMAAFIFIGSIIF